MAVYIKKRISGTVDIVSPSSLSNGAYLFAFGVFCFWRSLSYINIEQILFLDTDDIIAASKMIMLVCLVFKLFTQRYDLRSFILMSFVFTVLLISDQTSHSLQLVWALLFICAAKNVNFTSIVKICLIVYSGALILGILGWGLGLVEAVEAIRSDDTGIRTSLGFKHANSLGYIAMTVAFSFLVLRFPKYQTIDVLIVLIIAFGVITTSGSRTAFFAICIGLIIALVYCHCVKRGRNKLFPLICALSLGLLFLLSVLLMVFYNPNDISLVNLNHFLSYRLSYANHYYAHYSIAAIGSNIPQEVLMNTTSVLNGFIVDNAFCNLCLRSGFIPAVIFIGAWALVFVKAYKENYAGPCILALALWIAVAFSESTVLILSSNFGLIAIAALLYGYPLSELDSKERAGKGSRQQPQRL